jgi:hypothetical protein
MGLAASQARLLTITARKADCEFESMALSHQKLALARNMETVSSDYQDALNATKLVYDYYGSGDSDMALNYNLLMTPSVYNDYYPKLLTDSKNRVILDSSYAAAARAAGIPAEGLLGTPSSDVRNKFIEALAGADVITSLQASSIQGVGYSNTIGNGNTIGISTATTDVTYDELLDLIKANCDDTADYGISIATSSDKANVCDESYERLYTLNSSGEIISSYNEDGNAISSASISLYELLSSDNEYVLAYESAWGERTPITEAAALQEKIIGNDSQAGILTWLNDQFSSILGGSSVSDTALAYAYNAVYNLVYPSNDLQIADEYFQNNIMTEKASDRKHDTEPNDTCPGLGLTYREIMNEVGVETTYKLQNGFQTNLLTGNNGATEVLGFSYNAARNGSGKTHKQTSEVAVDLNNLAQLFLTAYVQYMQGIGDSNYSWEKGLLSASNLYDGTSDDYTFSIITDTEVDGDSQLYANFYDAMFNRICLNGWVENDQIDDADYMTELLKSGMAYISSISDDGYYYQGNYSTDPYISEVTDDEAIARAEAKYNTEKTKIENKEDTIDLKMKNLDTEISSLTTEYESTKQVITKAIEKSFKRYEA